MIRVVYFGTNEFSALLLQTLAATQGFTVVGVVTQPDRPVGRNQEMTAPAVKVAAEKLGLPIFQPESLKNIIAPGLIGGTLSLPPADIFMVYAYGLIIPQAILDLPLFGTINFHPSLLPKYRGPTPVQSAIINGDTETGVSIMLLDGQMDHGPILNKIKMPIKPDDTADTLTEKLVTAATPLLIQTIQDWISKKITPVPQDESQAVYCKILTRDDGRVDWSKPAPEIYNLFRGLTPWPGIWTMWEGKRLKLRKVKKSSSRLSAVPLARGNQEIKPGELIIDKDSLFISCGQGAIEVLELQLEGKKAMPVKTFLNGYKNFNSAKLA